MARHIVTAEASAYSGYIENAPPLAVDDWLTIDWKTTYKEELWTNTLIETPPSFNVRRYNYTTDHFFSVVGHIFSDDDKEWIRKSLILEREPRVFEPLPHLARVNEVGLNDPDTGKMVFKIEVLTGADREIIIAAARREEFIGYIKRYWWQAAVVSALLLWWFF